MAKPSPRSWIRKPPKYAKAAAAAIAVTFLGAGGWGARVFLFNRALTHAEEQLKSGFPSLAVETLEPYRFRLPESERGCVVALEIYFQNRSVERLDWLSQSCLSGGFELPAAYVALAAAHEFRGLDSDALKILNAAAPKFDKSPDIYYRMAQIFKRNKKDDAAVLALNKATERAPQNTQLAYEALEYYSSLEKWADARAMAERLKDAKIENPEIKLIIARAYIKGGDQNSGRLMVNQARELMDKKPEVKAVLEKAYGDILVGGTVVSNPAPAGSRSIASDGAVPAPVKP